MKNSKRLVSIAAVAILGTSLAACSSGPEAEPGAEPSFSIGFVNANTLEYHTCLEKGVAEAAESLGVKLTVVNSTADPAKEQTNVEDLLAQSPDALMLQTVNVDSLAQAVTKANTADVPIFMTSVAGNPEADILGAVVAQFAKSATLLADWASQDADGKSVNVAIVAGAPGAASDLFVNSFKENLSSNLNVVFEQPGMFNRGKAQEVAENLLQSNPDVEYIYVPNEEMSFGVLAALQAAGRDDIKILANGGTEAGLAAVESGDFTVMTTESAYELGHLALETVVQALEDEEIEKIQGLDPVLVTVDNIAEAPAYCG